MALKHYKFVADYRSGAGVWTKGQEIDLDEAAADWFNRDVPGCLELHEPKKAEDPEPETRAVEAPPQDRQMKAAPAKRGAP